MKYSLFVEVCEGVSKNTNQKYQCVRLYALYESGKRHLIQTVFISPQSNVCQIVGSLYGKENK